MGSFPGGADECPPLSLAIRTAASRSAWVSKSPSHWWNVSGERRGTVRALCPSTAALSKQGSEHQEGKKHPHVPAGTEKLMCMDAKEVRGKSVLPKGSWVFERFHGFWLS